VIEIEVVDFVPMCALMTFHSRSLALRQSAVPQPGVPVRVIIEVWASVLKQSRRERRYLYTEKL
jgi:hypothetical protein